MQKKRTNERMREGEDLCMMDGKWRPLGGGRISWAQYRVTV